MKYLITKDLEVLAECNSIEEARALIAADREREMLRLTLHKKLLKTFLKKHINLDIYDYKICEVIEHGKNA